MTETDRFCEKQESMEGLEKADCKEREMEKNNVPMDCKDRNGVWEALVREQKEERQESEFGGENRKVKAGFGNKKYHCVLV